MKKALLHIGVAGIVVLSGALHPVTAAAAPAPSRFDFDGDGLDDLVVGASFQRLSNAPPGTPRPGNGLVVYHSSKSTVDFLDQAPLLSGITFGGPLTAGNFNGDGYADLAVGAPGMRGGEVWVLYGSPVGLRATDAQLVKEGIAGVPGEAATENRFGAALAAGDVNRDGYDDLAVGAPDKTVSGATQAGSVTVLLGSASGITAGGAILLTQDTPGVPEAAEREDRFGAALAIGDVTGDGYADLAVGAPLDDAHLTNEDDGSITLFRGGAGGATTSGITFVSGAPHIGLQIPAKEILIADLNGDRRGDVVLTAPDSDGGQVFYLPGTAGGLTGAGHRILSRYTLGYPEDGHWGAFGRSVAAGDVTGDGLADLLVGDVGVDTTTVADAGGVFLIPGTRSGPTGAGVRLLTQGTGYRPYRGYTPEARKHETREYFGEAVTILNLDGAGPFDAVVGSPYEYLPGDTDEPAGILTRLVTPPVKPTSRASGPPWLAAPVIGPSRSGQDHARTGFSVYDFGYSLLHG